MFKVEALNKYEDFTFVNKKKKNVFHGCFVSRQITQTKPNTPVTAVSRFIVI